jgi:hypothetical protein
VLCSCSLAILRRGVLQPLERAEYALKGAAVEDQHGRVGGGGHCRRAFVCREQRELACRGQVGGGRSNDAGAFQQAGNGGGLQLAGEVGRGGGGGGGEGEVGGGGAWLYRTHWALKWTSPPRSLTCISLSILALRRSR